MKQFSIPFTYRSKLISKIKESRKQEDKMKKDFTPTKIELGELNIYLARHFGFCYGVENAIEIAFKTVDENPDKRIFLLSEMIHNPKVNEDLKNRGVQFLQDTKGKPIIPLENLTDEDIVIIPAFGTTLKMESDLNQRGIPTAKYNTTCPFVEKVWNRSKQIADKDYTVIVHGKPTHEETRATFSHAAFNAPTLVIKDFDEAVILGEYILGKREISTFREFFKGRFSEGFDPENDLKKIGVVNQTTMLASDTQGIAEYLKKIMMQKNNLSETESSSVFADTRDTLCYATNDNQTSVSGLLEQLADLAIVVGGYNSSNTSHLVELCEEKLPTYFINDASKITEDGSIHHFDLHEHTEKTTIDFLPNKKQVSILITSGASCPDSIVENVIRKIASLYNKEELLETLIEG